MSTGWDETRVLGRAIVGRRNKVILATKFGIVRDPRTDQRGVNGHPEYVAKVLRAEAAGRGLRLDLYYQHRVDTERPIEETVGEMSRLIEEGKVRHLGLSEATAATIRRALATYPITALQSEYSLWSRDLEDGILATCRELGIGLVAYSPLGRGFLTGQIKKFEDLAHDDYRRTSPRFQGENFQKNLQLVQRIQQMAREKSCTPAQLALAWVLGQGKDVVPIPGTTKRKNLDENLRALEISLTPAELARIEELAPRGVAAGERYNQEMMKRVGV